METNLCHFRGNCPYMVLSKFKVICEGCYYFTYPGETYPTKRGRDQFLAVLKATNVTKPEPDFYVSNPDFLEIV